MCAGFRREVEEAGTGQIFRARIFGAFLYLRAMEMAAAAAIERKEVGKMRRLVIKTALAVFAILALILVLEAGFAFAQEKIKFSGSSPK